MKLDLRFGWFFIDNFGLTSSFGLGLCMQRDMGYLHDGELVRCPGKSMGESSNEAKVIQHVIMSRNSRFGDVSGPQMISFGALSAC